MQHQVYFKMQLELKVVIERPSIFGDFETGEETELPRRITYSTIWQHCERRNSNETFFKKCVFVFHFLSMSFEIKKFFQGKEYRGNPVRIEPILKIENLVILIILSSRFFLCVIFRENFSKQIMRLRFCCHT